MQAPDYEGVKILRACEAITQAAAHRIRLPADAPAQSCSLHMLFAKYDLHLPLNRQSVVYGREGIDLDVSTPADWVGAAAATLMPLTEAIRAHVSRGNRGPL